MRGAAPSMQVLRPRDAAAALRARKRYPDALPIAGGTDVMVEWNAGQLNDRTILDLSALTEWQRIRKRRDAIYVGALVTHTQLQESALIRKHAPLLVAACATVGGSQIQNRGTLGGNIANASPAGDTFPPLSIYEAVVHASSGRGHRDISFDAIFAGVKKTTLLADELIEGVSIPIPTRPQRQLFRKVGTRAAQAISKTVVAGLLWLRRDGRARELRFALGSMAPTTRRLSAVEAFVRDKKLTPATVAKACALVREDVSPIDDIRSTAEYRLRVSENLLAAFLRGR